MSNSVLDAAYLTAHNYPGGVPALAARLGVNATVLSHKLNPNNHSHRLMASELVSLMHMANDHAALRALCMEFGYMPLPLPTLEHLPTNDAVNTAVHEFADFLQSVTAALADGKVTKLELRKVRKELGEMMASAGNLEAILAAMEAGTGGGRK